MKSGWGAFFLISILLPAIVLGSEEGFQDSPKEISRLRESRELNEELAQVKEFNEKGTPYVSRIPYIPQTWDYGLEFGSLFNRQNNYWTGLNIGRHLGTCVFTSSETCQQYGDLLTGIGGRESRTHFSSALSLRWQFVNFPTYWSTFARVFVGGESSIEPEGVRRNFIYGIGGGLTTYLHPRADLRIEARVGTGPYPFGQVFLSIQFKMDKWVEYFADRLKAFGVGTVNVTGKVIEATGSAVTIFTPSKPQASPVPSTEKKSDLKSE
jgi:hypothetical protein